MLKKNNFLALIAAFGFLGLQGAQAEDTKKKQCIEKCFKKYDDCVIKRKPNEAPCDPEEAIRCAQAC